MNISPMLQTNRKSRNEALRLYTDEQVSTNRHQYPSIDVLRDVEPAEPGANPEVPAWPPNQWRLINHLRALYFQEDVDMLYLKDEFAISAFFIDIATGHDRRNHPNRINEEGFLITLNSQVRRLALGRGISTVPVSPLSDFFRTGLDYVALFTGVDLIYVVLPELSAADMTRYKEDWENGLNDARRALSERGRGPVYHSASPTILWITQQQMNDMHTPEVIPPRIDGQVSRITSENAPQSSLTFEPGNSVPPSPSGSVTASQPPTEFLESISSPPRSMPPPPRPSIGNEILNSINDSLSGSIPNQSFPTSTILPSRPDSPRPPFPRQGYSGNNASPGSIFPLPSNRHTYNSPPGGALLASTSPRNAANVPPTLEVPAENSGSKSDPAEVECSPPDTPQSPSQSPDPPQNNPSSSSTDSKISTDLAPPVDVVSAHTPSSTPPQFISPPGAITTSPAPPTTRPSSLPFPSLPSLPQYSIIPSPVSFQTISHSPRPSAVPIAKSSPHDQAQQDKHTCNYYIPHLNRPCKNAIARDSKDRCRHHIGAENKVTCDYAGVKKGNGKSKRCGRKTMSLKTMCERHLDQGEYPQIVELGF